MKKRVLTMVVSAAMIVAALGAVGCGSSKAEDKTVYGQVTAVDGEKVTISVLEKNESEDQAGSKKADGEMPQMPEGETGEAPQMPEGETGEAPQMPEGETGEAPQMPEGETGEAPQMPEGETGENAQRSQGGKRGMMGYTATDEEETLTISDSVKVLIESQEGDSEEGSVDDIQSGSILELTYENDKLVSVTVKAGGMRDMKDKGNKSEKQNETETETSESANEA